MLPIQKLLTRNIFIEIKLSHELRDKYRGHLRDITIGRLRVALALAFFVVVMDCAVQYLFLGGMSRGFLLVRIETLITSIIILLIAQKKVFSRFAFSLSLIGILAMAGYIETAVVVTGGYHSTYQTGLSLLIVAAGLLFPYPFREMGIACTLIWLVYLLPVLTGLQDFNWSNGDLFVNGFFLICATVIALTASRVTDLLRHREFYSREALEEEEKKSELLLLNILPETIATRLKNNEEPITDRFDDVTVLFADIAGFTVLSSHMKPDEVTGMLNGLFSRFDILTEKYGLEKIKTIGDAYMAVGGAPLPMNDHVLASAGMACEMIEETGRYSRETGAALNIRIGLNRGPVTGGVIGRKKFIYDLWGDTVNTASRMESHGVPGKIHVTESIFNHLNDHYHFTSRGIIDVKGKGPMNTYFLLGPK